MRLVLTMLMLTLACAPQPAELGSAPPMASSGANADVFTNPAAFAGQTIETDAVFQGYRVADCTFAKEARASSHSRSDWLVRRGAYCLYVTGGRPGSLDPVDPGNAGKRLELRAQVRRDDDGKYLLELLEARERD